VGKNRKKLKCKKRICSELSVRGIGAVIAEEEEKDGSSGKDLQKRKVLSRNERVRG